MPDLLEPGTKAPDFSALDQDGKAVHLADYAGRPVVLYFYPADMTTGCTIEACTFRDELGDFQAAGAAVLGVSTQDEASHRAFRAKHNLNFPLVADPSKAICRSYRTLGLLGVAKRVTYVIGPDGTILDAFKSINPKPHVERALAVVREKGSNHAVEGPASAGPHSA